MYRLRLFSYPHSLPSTSLNNLQNFDEINLRVQKSNPPRYIVVPMVIIPLVLTTNNADIFGVDVDVTDPPVVVVLFTMEVSCSKSITDLLMSSSSLVISCSTILESR